MRTHSYEFARKGIQTCTLLFLQAAHCVQAKRFRPPLPPQTSSSQPIAEPPAHSSTIAHPLLSSAISTHLTLLPPNNYKSRAAAPYRLPPKKTRPTPN